jgi:hypothetical protein
VCNFLDWDALTSMPFWVVGGVVPERIDEREYVALVLIIHGFESFGWYFVGSR